MYPDLILTPLKFMGGLSLKVFLYTRSRVNMLENSSNSYDNTIGLSKYLITHLVILVLSSLLQKFAILLNLFILNFYIHVLSWFPSFACFVELFEFHFHLLCLHYLHFHNRFLYHYFLFIMTQRFKVNKT